MLVGVHWASVEWHRDSLLKREAIGIIFNWDISTTQPIPLSVYRPSPSLRFFLRGGGRGLYTDLRHQYIYIAYDSTSLTNLI